MIEMRSWDALPDAALRPAPIGSAFIESGARDFRAAARLLRDLRYGRNSVRDDPLIVLRENRGTCSTKHALLARLAAEQRMDVALMIGIYEMDPRNTPGIGDILRRHGLERVPEAHCYLMINGTRIDVTRDLGRRDAEPIARFLHEERIRPDQIGDYKAAMHRGFLARWIARTNSSIGIEELCRIREECIAALGE